jgi:hypothetical protein
MTKKEAKKELALIKKGIANFPKVLEQKKKAFQHKQKILRAFEPFSKAFLKEEIRLKKLK